ncbi:Hypothetical predicted protein, partial [Marmota monax]
GNGIPSNTLESSLTLPYHPKVRWRAFVHLWRKARFLNLFPVEIAINVEALVAQDHYLQVQQYLLGHNDLQVAQEMALAVQY